MTRPLLIFDSGVGGLTVLDELIKREVLFQRAEREKLLPTEDQIDGVINQQKQQSGMTSEDFEKGLRQQNISMETLREEARKDLAISSLQEKYSGKISISDKEVEDFFNTNKQQFVFSQLSVWKLVGRNFFF